MVDLHSHILPNIDDGSKSIQETLRMGKIAEAEGFSKMIATPHYIDGELISDKGKILSTIERVNEGFQKEGIDIEVLPGMEVYISPDIPAKLKNGEVLTLNNTPYILIEFPMNSMPIYTEEILYEIRLMGYKPVIAHPERYAKVAENPNCLKDLIEQGNYVQINSLSLIAKSERRAKRTAEILLRHRMVHFIGTDAHSSRTRSPKIREALNKMERWVGKEYVKEIIHNGRVLIEGGEVPIGQPATYESRKSFLNSVGRFFTWKEKEAYE